MRIRMLVGISGGRGDGTEWPPVGAEMDVDDEEGRALCAGRLAVPVPEQRAETAVPPQADVEQRDTPAKRPAVKK